VGPVYGQGHAAETIARVIARFLAVRRPAEGAAAV
jgi:hypothetical protein